jgi:CheY-like chemotaxis protein
MAIITVLSGSYCHGDEIISAISQKLGYRLLDDDLFATTARKCCVPREKLVRCFAGSEIRKTPDSKDRLRMLACLESTLAELIQEDKAIVSGCAGFLIPGNIAHVLRVCVAADLKYRTEQAVETEHISADEARNRIRDYDQDIGECATHLVSRAAYDESLYDMLVPVDKISVAGAVRAICEQAQSDAVQPTDWSIAQIKDFLLSARVKQALTEEGHRVDVYSEKGRVVIAINEQALRMGRLEEKLKQMAMEIDGVTDVVTKLGPKFTSASINPWEAIEAPPKVLLVDDEKEFVQTLSERLKTRNLGASIAYDGEQALEMIKDEVPDVIVLDLMMPGIDGIETLRRVKQSHPEVEVIILTGHGTDREQTAAEDLGAFAYLRKPVNVNELARLMKEAYARRRKHN